MKIYSVYNWIHKRLFVHNMIEDNCDNWNYDDVNY